MLVTKLQLASEQVSRKTTDVTDGVMKTLSRLLYDLRVITEDAQATQHGVDHVRKHLTLAETTDTDAVLDRLRQLHLVKTRMEKCCAALREAENWNNLEVEAMRVLEHGDYESAANRLSSAQTSLDAFTGDKSTAEYTRRRELLSQLRTELENALKPRVESALKARDEAECYKYYKIYGQIGRSEDFVDLYFEVRNEPKLVEHPDEDWVDSLATFYDHVFRFVSEEYIWCAAVFSDPKPVVQALVQHILQSLDPPVADRLAAIATTHQDVRALPRLVVAFTATESFGLSLEKLFTKPPVNTASFGEASFESRIKTHTRKRSNSTQMTLVPLTLRHADANAWSYVLYVPFLPFQSQFATFESRYLQRQLEQTLSQAGDTAIISGVFEAANASLDRCLKFTHGFAAAEWLRTVNAFIIEVKRTLDQRLKKLERPTKDIKGEDDDFDLEESDWSTFQVYVRFLDVCRSFDLGMRTFEEAVSRALEGVRGYIQEKDQDENPLLSPVTPSVFSFSERRRASLDVAVAKPKHERKRSSVTNSFVATDPPEPIHPKASLALLRTSRLNSAELQRIMSQVSSVQEDGDANAVHMLLQPAEAQISQLTQDCQAGVHEAVLAPIAQHLDTIPSLESKVWTAPDPQPRKSVVEDATIDIDMPQFSLSPNDYITRVGEQLLLLPQHFEVYAVDNNALAYHTETIPFHEEAPAANDAASEEEEDEEEASEMIQVWTASVARGATKKFLDEIVKIPKLTAQGRRQLRIDIEYLVNVLSALDVAPLPELVQFHETLAI